MTASTNYTVTGGVNYTPNDAGTDPETEGPEFGMFTEPQPDGVATPLPWELASLTQKSGVRSSGHNLEATINHVHAEYRSAYNDVLEATVPVANFEADSIRQVMSASQQGKAWLLPQVRLEAGVTELTNAMGTAQAALDRAEQELTVLEAKAERATRATRPDPGRFSDTAEATLKSDLRMRLDSIPDEQLLEEVTNLLKDAARTEDDGMLWTLAHSPWAAWYLQSRGFDPVQMHKFEAARVEHGQIPESVTRAQEFLTEQLPALAQHVSACRAVHAFSVDNYREAMTRWLADNVR